LQVNAVKQGTGTHHTINHRCRLFVMSTGAFFTHGAQGTKDV